MSDNTTPLTGEELTALAALEDAATPWPWHWNSYDGVFGEPHQGEDGIWSVEAIAWIDEVPNTDEQHGDSLHTEQGRANAALIPACRNALPRLLATITTLNAEVKRLDRMLRGLIPT